VAGGFFVSDLYDGIARTSTKRKAYFLCPQAPPPRREQPNFARSSGSSSASSGIDPVGHRHKVYSCHHRSTDWHRPRQIAGALFHIGLEQKCSHCTSSARIRPLVIKSPCHRTMRLIVTSPTAVEQSQDHIIVPIPENASLFSVNAARCPHCGRV